LRTGDVLESVWSFLFRIEGDNSTPAKLQPAVEPLAEFAQAVNVNYTLGVDLMNGNLIPSVAEAVQWVNGIPNNLIQAIEIGNEPDLYVSQNARPVLPYDFPEYLAQYQEWLAGIDLAIGTNFGVVAPSLATSNWKLSTEAAFENGTLTPTIASQHAYCAGPASEDPDLQSRQTRLRRIRVLVGIFGRMIVSFQGNRSYIPLACEATIPRR